jgi:hypothetical protein
LLSDLVDFNVFLGVFKGGPRLAFFGLGFGGWKFGMCGWAAGFSMFACNVFRRKKWRKKLRRFLGLCERVSLSLSLCGDFACRFWMKRTFFAKPLLGLGLVLGW